MGLSYDFLAISIDLGLIFRDMVLSYDFLAISIISIDKRGMGKEEGKKGLTISSVLIGRKR